MILENNINNKKLTELKEMIEIDLDVAQDLKNMDIDKQHIKIIIENLQNYLEILNAN